MTFDLDALEVTGDPVPMVEGVMIKGSGAASLALSDIGSLVYVSGAERGPVQRTFVWVDREGREEALPLPPGPYQYPRL